MKVELNAQTLHNLLRPVIPMTTNDWSLPVLERIVLRAQGEYLTASVTDRFRIGVQRVRVESSEGDPFSATINRHDALKLLPLFKPNRRGLVHQPRLTLEVVGDTVVIEAAAPPAEGKHATPAHEFEAMRLVVGNEAERDSAQFPDIWKLATTRLAKDPGERQEVVLNFDLLAGFKEAVKANSEYGQHSVRLSVAGDGNNDPVIVEIGEDFIGLLMPRRPVSAETKPIGDGWADALRDLSARALEGTKAKALTS